MSPVKQLSVAAGASKHRLLFLFTFYNLWVEQNKMDQDSYSIFLETLKRYVKERLVPAEKEVIKEDEISQSLLCLLYTSPSPRD